VVRPAAATLECSSHVRANRRGRPFALVLIWALVAMAVAQFPAIRDNTVLSILYYVIAGLGWVLPAMPLVSWMSGPTVRQ